MLGRVTEEAIREMSVSMRRLANAQEALLTVARTQVEADSEPVEKLERIEQIACPHCGTENPEVNFIERPSVTAKLTDSVSVADCMTCGNRIYMVPMTMALFDDPDTLKAVCGE